MDTSSTLTPIGFGRFAWVLCTKKTHDGSLRYNCCAAKKLWIAVSVLVCLTERGSWIGCHRIVIMSHWCPIQDNTLHVTLCTFVPLFLTTTWCVYVFICLHSALSDTAEWWAENWALKSVAAEFWSVQMVSDATHSMLLRNQKLYSTLLVEFWRIFINTCLNNSNDSLFGLPLCIALRLSSCKFRKKEEKNKNEINIHRLIVC